MRNDLEFDQRMTDRDDVYYMAHAVENALFNYAKETNMTVEQAREFFVWALNAMILEAQQDLNFALAEINGGSIPMSNAIIFKNNEEPIE